MRRNHTRSREDSLPALYVTLMSLTDRKPHSSSTDTRFATCVMYVVGVHGRGSAHGLVSAVATVRVLDPPLWPASAVACSAHLLLALDHGLEFRDELPPRQRVPPLPGFPIATDCTTVAWNPSEPFRVTPKIDSERSAFFTRRDGAQSFDPGTLVRVYVGVLGSSYSSPCNLMTINGSR